MIVSKEFTFEASHQILGHPGKCARLHGHSWRLVVYVKGDINPSTHMVLDYFDLKGVVQPLIDRLDHHHLGFGYTMCGDLNIWVPATVEGLPVGFIPTSENLLLWIADQLPHDFPWEMLELKETCTSSAILYRDEWLYKRAREHYRKEEPTDAGKTVIEERESGNEEEGS